MIIKQNKRAVIADQISTHAIALVLDNSGTFLLPNLKGFYASTNPLIS